MGFLSKLWKGIKKTFKKIGKGIKKVFKSVGKFMNKIGIVGQIAMMFLPISGLSSIFGALGKAGSKALGWLNKFGAIGQGAAKVLGGAYKFARAVAKPFVDISKGVMGFVTDTTKFVLNKIPGVNIASAPTSIFGEGGAWATAQERVTGAFKGFTGDIADAFSGNIDDLLPKPKVTNINVDLQSDELTPDFVEDLPETLDTGKGLQVNEKYSPLESQVSIDMAPKSYSILGEPGSLESTASSTFNVSKLDPELLKTEPSFMENLGAAFKAAPGKALDKFASIPASLAQTKLGQAMNIYDSPVGEQGPLWAARASGLYSSMPTAMSVISQSVDDMEGYRSMGLAQGGYEVGMPEGMGYGGFNAFQNIYEDTFNSLYPKNR